MLTAIFRLPPKARLLVGIVLLLLGPVLLVLLWGRGVLWGFPLLAIVIGLISVVSGALGLKSQGARQTLQASVESRRDEIVAAMVAEKQAGRNPIRWLNQQQILDGELRQSLIDAMNERLKSPS